MKSSAYITIVIIAGLVLIGYLFQTAPDTAPAQLPLILAGVGALVAVLNKQGDTDAKVEKTDAKVDKSIAVSVENAQSIAAVSQQTNHGLEGVNQKVDGHLTALTSKIDALMDKVATLEKDKAVKELAAAHAETSADKIIAAMPAAVVAALAYTPLGTPVVEPPSQPDPITGDHS